MKIVYLVSDLEGLHGWSTYALNIVNEAVKANHTIIALVHKKTTSKINGVDQFEILPPPHSVTWNPVLIFKVACKIRKILNATNPDIVHVTVEPYLQFWQFLTKKYKLICTIHGTYARLPLTVPKGLRRYLSAKLFLGALKKIDSIIAVSENTKQLFLSYAAINFKSKIFVIHNSIMIPPSLHTENRAILYQDKINIVTVGAVKRRKGIHLAMRYFSEWAEKNDVNIIHHVVGSVDEKSPYVIEVRKKAAEYANRNFSVIFHGSLSESQKISLLRSAKLYVHLEDVELDDLDVEGFGIGIIEAAGYGVPALVAKKSATAEAVSDGVSGYCVDLNSHSEIMNAIDDILKNGILNPIAIREWANLHNPELIFKMIADVYEM